MPAQPGDIKLNPPIQATLISVDGRSVPGIKVYFSVRGHGNYDVAIPREGWTPEKLQQAVIAEASKVVDALDLFK